jgi:hypothetical protein
MPSSLTPGSSIIVTVQYLDADTGLRREPTGSTLPVIPQSVSRGGSFRGFTGSRLLRPVRLLAPLYGSDWDTSPATGDFYIQASNGSVTLPAAGYDYDSHWTPLSAGLAPAGMAASFAALTTIEPRHSFLEGFALDVDAWWRHVETQGWPLTTQAKPLAERSWRNARFGYC